MDEASPTCTTSRLFYRQQCVALHDQLEAMDSHLSKLIVIVISEYMLLSRMISFKQTVTLRRMLKRGSSVFFPLQFCLHFGG